MANFHLIKKIAQEKGIALVDLAEKVGITPAGITLIMKSNSTNTKTIESIAHELGVKVGVFFDEPEPEKKPLDPFDIDFLLEHKNAIIAQKDKIIAQKDEIIRVLSANQRVS